MDLSLMCQQLPKTAPESVLRYALHKYLDDLGGERTVYKRVHMSVTPDLMQAIMTPEMWEEYETSRKRKWAAECTCSVCGEVWHTAWINDSFLKSIALVEGENGLTYPCLDDYDPSFGTFIEVAPNDRFLCPFCSSVTTLTHASSIRGGRTWRLLIASVENVGIYTTIFYWLVARTIDEDGYEIYFHGALPAPEQAHAIAAWLLGSAGYQRLEDVYDPNYYRMAICKGPLDIENRLNKYGRCTLHFDCAPQSFLKTGEYPHVFSASGMLHNTTAFNAQPIITVYGTDAGTVTVGSTVVEIKAISDPIILDCEQMQAYSQPGEGAPENQNGNIYAPVFPVLIPGENAIAFSGGITKIEIIPRWWTL